MEQSEKSEIAKRTYKFSLDLIKTVVSLPKNVVNFVLVKQVIRSGTSIGANIEEALGAHTKNDFTYGMNVAKKEARETRYWLKMLNETNPQFQSKLSVLLNENLEIINILTKIVKTSSSK